MARKQFSKLDAINNLIEAKDSIKGEAEDIVEEVDRWFASRLKSENWDTAQKSLNVMKGSVERMEEMIEKADALLDELVLEEMDKEDNED